MPKTLQDGELLAAVDIGSNSFHMIVARHEHGTLRVIDRLRDTVRLAAGLSADGTLAPAAKQRALDCLSRMGDRLHTMPPHRVRAVATNTVRRMRAPAAFLLTAETALGHPIEVVSGREEARLIYLGVAHGLPPRKTQRLVVDIGGGSTEFIIGRGFEPLKRESLQFGCVATTLRCFRGGKLGRKRWEDGRTDIELELQQFARSFIDLGWQDCIGSSGSAKAVAEILQQLGGDPERGITADGVALLRERILSAGQIDRIELPGMKDERRDVIAGGVMILEAVFETFGLSSMKVCDTAMREGLLYDMLGRAEHDPRDASIAALASRYGVDARHAARVGQTALALFDAAAPRWALDEEARQWLDWAVQVHELGLAIAHSQHHQHGAYVLEHADLAGFSQQEQQVLAYLVRGQRRKFPGQRHGELPERMRLPALRTLVLLRLAILLHRARDTEPLPALALEVEDGTLALTLPRTWLQRHPLILADLDAELRQLEPHGLRLQMRTA